MRSIICTILTGLFLAQSLLANPFFAMDTSIRNLNMAPKVKELGYDGIGWKLGSAKEINGAKEKATETGLKLFAFYSYAGATLTKTELNWAASMEEELAALEGTDAILWLPIQSRDFAFSSPEGDTVAVPALQRLADLAAARKVKIALYPHVGNWMERVQDAVRLAKQVNRPNFGVTFNLCHCLKLGDEDKIPQLLTEAAPYLFLVTINGADSHIEKGGWDRLIQPLDQGTYDIRLLLNKLKELHYSGPIGLQGFGVKIPVPDNLTRSIEMWKKVTQ